jgi:hypothetical protein
MNTMEDRARTAMRAIASTVDDAPELRLPPAPAAPTRAAAPVARRWRIWIAPVMAAAAMLAVGLTLAIVRGIPNGGGASPVLPAFSSGVPRYYVALDGPTGNDPAPAKVVVGDTFSGPLFTLGPFAGGGAVSVTAAADGLTFVVGTEHYQPPSPTAPTSWYLIRITPGSPVSATVRALPIPVQASAWVSSMALSPDGKQLALMGFLGGQTVLRTYSVTSGALLRTWTHPLPRGTAVLAFPGTLWWAADGRVLAWGYSESGRANTFGVWLLQVSRPGHDLFADSRLVWSTQVTGNFDLTSKRPFTCAGESPSVLVTADGKTIVCGAWGVFRSPGNLPSGTCPTAPPWNDQGFLEYSTATGKLTRTLYRYDTSCIPYLGPAQVLWASTSGDTVIGYFDFQAMFPASSKPVVRFGIYRENKFTPLPAPPSTNPGTVAW